MPTKNQLIRHSITKKTVILERPRIPAMKPTRHWRMKSAGYSSTQGRKVSLVTLHTRGIWTALNELLPVVAHAIGQAAEILPEPQGGAAQVVQETPAPQEWTAPLSPIVPPSCQTLADYRQNIVSHPNALNLFDYPRVSHSITSNPPMDLSPTMDEPPLSLKKINKDCFGKQLLEAQRKRTLLLESAELKEYLSKVSSENIELECKVIEYEIYFKNHYFYNKLQHVLRHRMPMLHESTTRLVPLHEEEERLRELLALILRKQCLEYTLPNLWQLEKNLAKPEMCDSLINPVLSELQTYFPPNKRKL